MNDHGFRTQDCISTSFCVLNLRSMALSPRPCCFINTALPTAPDVGLNPLKRKAKVSKMAEIEVSYVFIEVWSLRYGNKLISRKCLFFESNMCSVLLIVRKAVWFGRECICRNSLYLQDIFFPIFLCGKIHKTWKLVCEPCLNVPFSGIKRMHFAVLQSAFHLAELDLCTHQRMTPHCSFPQPVMLRFHFISVWFRLL